MTTATVSWLDARRRAASELLGRQGFPGSNHEDWRFTPVDLLAKADFSAKGAARPSLDTALPPGLPSFRAVFVDGRFAPELSALGGLPKGAVVGSLAAALAAAPERLEGALGAAADATAFAAANTAGFVDGLLVDLPAGCALDRPIHALFLSSGGSLPRLLVRLGRGASASLIEEHAGAGAADCVGEVVLADGSRLSHARLQRAEPRALHVGLTAARVGRDASYWSGDYQLGARLSRHDLRVTLAAEGADAQLDGLCLLDGTRHVDCHTLVEHAAPHGASRELYKGVLDDASRLVFNGAVHVAPNAQKTDANVHNKNLLLSEDGLVNTKPEFQIHANDVQCRHGAAIGQLSADALFYLRSRGLSKEEARELLVYAFASEMVSRAPEALREPLETIVRARLRGPESHA